MKKAGIANVKKACIPRDFCLEKSGSIADRGDKDTNKQPIVHTMEVTSCCSPWDSDQRKILYLHSGGVDHLQEESS